MKTVTNIIIFLSWVLLILWGFGMLTGCAHTKKAFAELSKKVDSVFVSRSDTSYRNKKDSSNTVIEFHGADIYFDENEPTKRTPGDLTIQPGDFIDNNSGGFTRLPIPNKKTIRIHIDSGTITHGKIVTINSGKVSKVDSVHVKSEEKQKTKTVDRKGANAVSTIIIWACIIGLIIFLVLKFKSKIPIIKNL